MIVLIAYVLKGGCQRTFMWDQVRGHSFQTSDLGPLHDSLTQIGSKEYYEGFLKSDLRDDSINNSERGDGLEQALKLGLYSAGVLGLLLLGFLASNGLLST